VKVFKSEAVKSDSPVCKNRQGIYNLGQTSKNIVVIYCYF